MRMINRLQALLNGRTPQVKITTDAGMNPSCTEFEVNNWMISEFILEKLVPVVGTHPFPLNELMLMTAAVCRLKPLQIFEWGTHIGKSARIFYECANHFGIQTEIHSIDLHDDVNHVEHPHESRGRLVRGLRGVELHQGDGIDVALKLWRSSGQKSQPLFFVDGDHSYESVSGELLAIVKEIPNANILLHDTFYQSAGSGYNVGPHRAVEDVLRLNPARYQSINSGLGLPGLTLLYQL